MTSTRSIQVPLPLVESCAVVEWTQVIHLPRLTGEVARRAGGGKPQEGYLQIPDLNISEIVCVAFPLRPVRRGTSPVKRGRSDIRELCPLRSGLGGGEQEIRTGSDHA